MRKKNKKQGFTIFELLTVLVILSVVSLIAVPTYSRVSKSMMKAGIRKQIESAYNHARTVAKTKLNKIKFKTYLNRIDIIAMKQEESVWVEGEVIQSVKLDKRFTFDVGKNMIFDVRGFPEQNITFDMVSNDKVINVKTDIYIDGTIKITIT